MSWARLDDGLHSHPKFLRLMVAGADGFAALGLWTAALTYAAGHTGGFVPREWAVMTCREQLDGWAKLLVDAGLWTPVEDGWQIHDYLDYNPSPSDRAQLSEKRREAGKRGAEARWRKQANGNLPFSGHSGANSPVPVPVPVPKPDTTAAARASHDGITEELHRRLTDAGLTIATDRLAAIVAKHPTRDLDRAAAELVDWAQREQVRSPAAALECILADQPDEPARPAAPDATAASTWAAAREQLRSALGDDTFERWLADVELVGQDGAELVLVAPGRGSWIERFDAQITEALDGRPHRIAASPNGRPR